jgi:hypothetical protein
VQRRQTIKTIFILLLIQLPACNPQPNLPTFSEEEKQTEIAFRVAETLMLFTQDPSETKLPTLIPSLTSTPTPLSLMLTVSENTICREGTDKQFKSLGLIEAGEVINVVARSYDGLYWYIQNPDQPGSQCWIWGGVATLSTDDAILPVFTSLPTSTPTPGPDFIMSYMKMLHCGDDYILEFKITNTGIQKFESSDLTVTDVNTGEIRHSMDWRFEDFVDCFIYYTYTSTINPGESFSHLRVKYNYDPTGNNLIAGLKMCQYSKNSGVCINRTIFIQP